MAQNLSQAAEHVRRCDRERFVTALFAKAEQREGLMVLYAFNAEVARVRESVREPLAGDIRLQWWRDVIAGARPEDEIARHPVAAPLRHLVAGGILPAVRLERILDGRERDLAAEPFADLAELESYAEATSGQLSQAALAVLGVGGGDTVAAAGAVGTAFALAGLMRAVPHQLSTGRSTIPEAALAAAGTSSAAMLAGRAPRAAVAAAARCVGERARALLAEARARRIDRRGLPALLPATLASGHLARLERAGWDVFAGHLARPATAPLRLTLNWALGRF